MVSNSKITVLYQSDCGFCNTCRKFIEERNDLGSITLRGYTSISGRQFMDQHPDFAQKSDETILVIDEKEGIHEKFQACLVIARHMHRPWPIIGKALEYQTNGIL